MSIHITVEICQMPNSLNNFFLVAEEDPLVKILGLGIIAGSLPAELMAELDLDPDPSKPLLAKIYHPDYLKSVDLVPEVL